MRAIFLKELLSSSEIISVSDERFHHLANVVRLKEGEEVLVLNGNGLVGNASVFSIQKKSLEVKIRNLKSMNREHEVDLLQGITKRDAFDEIIRSSVELGISSLHPFESEFSQKSMPSLERVERIIESAVIQSNNPFSTTVEKSVRKSDLAKLFSRFDEVIIFDLVEKPKTTTVVEKKRTLFVIGPEGGFSETEREFFKSCSNTQFINFKTPILTAPVALSVGMGYWLARNDFQKS